MYPKTFFEDKKDMKSEKGTCYVLMPFAEQFREVYLKISETIEGDELGFICRRADDFFGGGHIIEDVLRNIGTCEILIADLTTKNANVFYELGITHMVKDIRNVIIITQHMDDVPFDIQTYRYIKYEQNDQGLKKLKHDLIEAVKPITFRSYRFEVMEGTIYKFPEKLLGKGRYMYDFRIPQVYAGGNGAKFLLEITRHAVQEPPHTYSESYGIMSGESIPMHVIPYSLKLERVDRGIAYFMLVPESVPNL